MGLPCGTFSRRYEEDVAIVRTRWQWIMMLAGVALLFGVSLALPRIWLIWLIIVGIYAVGTLGLHVITGLCGMFSMGHAAFMAVGAYTTAVLSANYGLSPWLSLPISAAAAGVAGLIFAGPAARIKGFYLVVSSIAAQYVVVWGLKQLDWTGGTDGIRVPLLPGIQSGGSDDYLHFWWLTLAIVVLSIYAVKNIQRMSTGRQFIAVRDNDLAARVMGINVFRTKLKAFFIGSCLAGVAGWLWAHFYHWITPDQFSMMMSVWMLGMLIVGGMGSTAGAIFGVVFIRSCDKLAELMTPPLQDAFPDLSVQILPAVSVFVFCIVVALFIALEPRGINYQFERFKLNYRMHPF